MVHEKKIPIMFKAFCDENRVQILNLLSSGEQCACVLLESLQISQPTLSHHMKILLESGIVSMRKEGKWAYYSLSSSGIEEAILYLQSLITQDFSSNTDS